MPWVLHTGQGPHAVLRDLLIISPSNLSHGLTCDIKFSNSLIPKASLSLLYALDSPISPEWFQSLSHAALQVAFAASLLGVQAGAW